MDKILFTEENLSKIHISQFEQFLKKHNIEYNKFDSKETDRKILKFGLYYEDEDVSYSFTCYFYFDFSDIADINNGTMEQEHNWGYDIQLFNFLINYLHKDYVQGDLSQFHVLFTKVYNEIMGYEIK